MTTNLLSVIEQQHKALERMHLWADSQADAQSKGGHATFDLMQLREERDAMIPAIAAGQQALEQTQVEAPKEQMSVWEAINRYQNQHARLVIAATELIAEVESNLETKQSPIKYAVPFGAVNKLRQALENTHPQATEPAPSTAGELPFPEADLTGVQVCCGNYDRCGRPCTPRGRWLAERDHAALLQSTADHIPDAGKMVAAMPVGELTDEQIDAVLGAAYLKLVKETGYTGGMGGETWDKTAARAILAAASSQPVREPMTDGPVISGYAIPVSEKRFADEILIQRSRQIEGPPLWAVRLNGNCLNKQGQWEWEPMPSSRDDEFLARCRFDSAESAIAAAHGITKKGAPGAAKEQTP